MGFPLSSIFLFMGLLSPAARAAGVPPPPDPVPGGAQERLEPPYLHLPVFLHFRKPRVDRRHFAPAHGKSREPLPERVRQLLVPAPQRRLKSRVRPRGPVSVTCTPGEMRVRVHTAHLGEGGERVHVRLGTCDVSRATKQSVLFQNPLHECGTQRQVINNTVVYSNMLHYTPDAAVSGAEMFSVPVQCQFNRFYYSYKIGYVPSVEKLKFFKPMKTQGSITLAACDAQWNRLSPTEGFVLGRPMYFEAETLYVPDGERLFIHFCHVTANSSRVSTPQVKIIDNYGCLSHSKGSSQSRFINSTRRNVVRFTIDAFTLRGKVQKYLFIHCEMSIRSLIPTETSKSCTYNQLERRWEELYGADPVCVCCDTSCVPEIPTLMQPLTSELGALVKQHPEGTSSDIPTRSTERIFTPELELGIRMTESQHKTTIPELKLAMESTPTLEGNHGTLTPERDHGPITTESSLMLEDKHGILVPDSEQGKITLENTLTWASNRGMLTPVSEHEKITLESTPALEAGHGIPMPGSEHEILTSEHKNGTQTLESEHGKVTLETPPTLESERRTLMPLSERWTLIPDTDREKITSSLHEQGSPGALAPSGGENTITLVHKHTELHEPHRIFEEVFGLS